MAIPTIAYLVTLAVESISGYLQSKRNKAMAKAMDTLPANQKGLANRLYKYEDDLLFYGTFSLNSTEEILSSIQGIFLRQSSLEGHIRELHEQWPTLYLLTILGSI